VYFIATLPSSFTGTANIQALFPYFAPYAILAVGEVFLMINGEIDLSIGGVYLFAPYLYYELANGHVPLLPAVLISFAACTAIGLVNGLITMVVGISSFVTTLGTLFTLEGFTLIISHAEQVTSARFAAGGSATSNSLSSFASVFGAGTYSELIWAVVIVAIMHVVLAQTRWGVHTIAVGSNKLGAAEAGVRVRWVVIRNFMVCSTFAGIVGILEAVRTSSITPDPSGAGVLTLSGDRLRGDRRHAADRRRRHRHRRADRRAVPGHPPGRPGDQGRQRRLPRLLPRARDPVGDGDQHLRGSRAKGIRPWLTRHFPASTSSRRSRRPTTCCVSSTSPRASVRSRRCATSACTSRRARCSACSATTAPASRR
jgi:ribose/xylose/arabinose/galactoside ABC-type transport system permease subunit